MADENKQNSNQEQVHTEAPTENLKTKGTELEEERGWLHNLYLHLPQESSGWTRYIRDFFTCLEFLTRLRITKRDAWFPDEFARSVKFFPVVGFIIGLFMALVFYFEQRLHLPQFLSAVVLLVAELLLIGTLMYDGFMDTCDGVFSGRTRSRILEIMQDSHAGTNAVVGLVFIVLLKLALLLALPRILMTGILITMYIATRTFMVIYIIHFPNARPGGLGAMFKNGASSKSTIVALIVAIVLIFLVGPMYLLPAGIALILGLGVACYLTSVLGGLTGDTFGALTECGDVFFLFSAFLLYSWNILR